MILFTLSDGAITDDQVKSIKKVIDRSRGAQEVKIQITINGECEEYDCRWLQSLIAIDHAEIREMVNRIKDVYPISPNSNITQKQIKLFADLGITGITVSSLANSYMKRKISTLEALL